MDVTVTTDTTEAALADLAKQLDAARPYNLGAPGARDFPPLTPALQPLMGHLLNNVGDLTDTRGNDLDGVYPWHTKRFERQVVDDLANLFGAPRDHWGIMTPSGTDSNRQALHIARASLIADRPKSTPMAFFFASAHVSVPLALDQLQIPYICLQVRRPSDMADLDDLEAQLQHYRDRPIIVVATIGTTVTEAVDDVARIRDILRAAHVPHWIHADAALSGIPLALIPGEGRTPFGFHDGADSICVSGHKFPGVPLVCSALLVRHLGAVAAARQYVGYTGTHTTAATSRPGHPPLLWWYANQFWGRDGLRERVRFSRDLARRTHHRLTTEAGGNWFRNPLGVTIVACDGLPPAITTKWHLSEGAPTRIYVMPGVTEHQADEFVHDVKEYVRAR